MRRQLKRLAAVKDQMFGVSIREILASIGPSALVLAAGLLLGYLYVDPAPPRKLHMTVGRDDDAYRDYADRYKEALAADGITLGIELSAGAPEDLVRLRDRKFDADIGFVQDGLHDGKDVDLLSLGSVNYEPIWVFYRGTRPISRLSAFEGKRIAIGADGSGTQVFSRRLLGATGLTESNAALRAIGGDAAVGVLKAGEVDAAFFLGTPGSGLIRSLLDDPDLHPMNFDQADAYSRQFPFLHPLVLPHGAIDLSRNIPSQDLHLLATTSTLVIRETLHPALVSLLMKAMKEIHGEATLLNKEHEFPADRDVDFQLSPDAERFYKSGPPFLQRYLPFWLATFFDRSLLVLLPLLAIMVPLIRIVPTIYAWRVKNRMYRWYGELKFLETQLRDASAPEHFDEYLAKVDWIEEQVAHMRIPINYSEHFYVLQEHIDLVRRKTLRSKNLSAALPGSIDP
jgi:uncharacterized protein